MENQLIQRTGMNYDRKRNSIIDRIFKQIWLYENNWF